MSQQTWRSVSTVIKQEWDDEPFTSPYGVWPSNQSSDTSEVLFNDLIAKAYQFKQLEQYERSALNAKLQREVEKNESMSAELKRKEQEISDLRNEIKKFRAEKALLNNRLRSIIDFSHAADQSHDIADADGSVQLNHKRRRDIDLDASSICEENATIKRVKIVVDSVVTSSNSNDDTTYVPGDEPAESGLASQITQKDVTINNVGIESVDRGAECSASYSADFAHSSNNAAVEQWVNPILSKQRNARRNIKKVIDLENLTVESKVAYQKEKDRRKQYCNRVEKYSMVYGALPGELNKLDTLVLDFDFDTKAELLAVDRRLSVKLKPHQCDGVKFMWDACFESIEKLRHSHGSGCILSHCMGLGKTLQVITLVHTLLTHSAETKVKKVLIISPVNVILNWVDEFDMWLKQFKKEEQIQIYEMATCNSGERVNRLKSWHRTGGVFIIGYKSFQTMYQLVGKKSNSAESKILFDAFIDPGADLVVCDEGHLLKNPTSQLSLALNKIRTLRRIVLTGTPLQNNLREYFSMVEFVKPRLLGTEKEFNNRFVGPISNGQFADSTVDDIKLMTHRANNLHKLLGGCVHRRDYSVLAKFLPPKQEYVLFIRLTQQQIDLYKFYMVKFAEAKPIADLPYLKRICNHPKVLAESEDRRKKKPTDTQKLATATENGEKALDKNGGWWRTVCSDCDQLELSNKMSILLAILSECEARDEKLIVFSGCLGTLNVIEHFLAKITERTRHSNPSPTEFKGFWLRDVDYSRLDGSQSAEKRKRDVTRFNKETNVRTRLFLISTKAGGLGINLMAASRVVIFDASWNPSDDIQSIFRAYRIGQKKACYIYRFISLGTMEEKIYDRQVTKLSIAKRVIDEHEINRIYKEEDLQQLYCVKNLDPPADFQTQSLTGDDLLNEVLWKYPDAIYKQHDHDSLLQNVSDEPSTDEEVGDVWEDLD